VGDIKDVVVAQRMALITRDLQSEGLFLNVDADAARSGNGNGGDEGV
jgi:hypothetical protein